MGHLDDMFQFSGLFLHFRSEKEGSGRDDLMKMRSGVERRVYLKTRGGGVGGTLTFLWNLVKDWTM